MSGRYDREAAGVCSCSPAPESPPRLHLSSSGIRSTGPWCQQVWGPPTWGTPTFPTGWDAWRFPLAFLTGDTPSDPPAPASPGHHRFPSLIGPFISVSPATALTQALPLVAWNMAVIMVLENNDRILSIFVVLVSYGILVS